MALKLKQELGLTTGIAFITGSIIGSGIFISPTPVLSGAGSSMGLALLIWLGAGVLTTLGSLSFIELAIRIRKSGGIYIFLHEAFGENVSFLYLWSDLFLLRPLSASLSMRATGLYVLRPLFLECPDLIPKIGVDLVGLLILYFCLAVNIYSMKHTSYLINTLTACKVGALSLIIVGGLIHLGQGKVSHFKDSFEIGPLSPECLLFAVYTAIYAYYGGNNISTLYEEFKNPKRSLILSTIVGHLIPVITYLLANVAYYAVLSKEEILSGVTVAVVFGERRLGPLKWVILPCVAISTAGIANTNLIVSSRATYVAAREGKFPKVFAMLNIKRKTPVPALVIMAAITTVVVLLLDFLSLLKIYTFLRSLFDSVAIYGLFRIRKRFNPKDSLKLPLVIPGVYVLILTFFAVNTLIFTPKIWEITLIAVFTAIFAKLLYYLGSDPSSKIGELLTSISEYFEKFFSSIFLCGESDANFEDDGS